MSRLFITGATGFLGKHVVLAALKRGHSVVASLRDPARAEDVRRAVGPHLDAPPGERLTFVTLDLTDDAGWTGAMDGCDALLHTASPFPLTSPKDEDALIRPAVDGTLRALKSARASGVTRVVLTASVVTVDSCDKPSGEPFDESDWTDLDHPTVGAYIRSKTLAERAAWDFAGEKGLRLTTIHPSLIVGTPLDPDFGSSVSVIQRMLKGRDPMVPKFGFTCVDVEDVAEAHLAALDHPEAEGLRIITAADALWFREIGETLKAAFPDRRIPWREAPNWVIRLLGLFDPAIRSLVPSLGRLDVVSNARARQVLGIEFTPSREAILKTARYLVDNNLV